MLLDLLRARRGALQREWALNGVAAFADDDLLPLREHVDEGLLQVGDALERARRGRYGLCTHCGKPIDFERLLAHPAASRCWPCELAAEARDEAAGAVAH